MYSCIHVEYRAIVKQLITYRKNIAARSVNVKGDQPNSSEVSLSGLSQHWWFRGILGVLLIAGVFQLGYIMGNLAFAGSSWRNISALQVAIIGSGVWALYEIISIMRRTELT